MQENNILQGNIRIIVANDPDPGYMFFSWTGDTQYLVDSLSASTTVNIPGVNTAFSPIYTLLPTTTTTTTMSSPTSLFFTFNIASSGETLKLPLTTGNTSQFNFDINWGDGNSETITTANASHVYATSGIKTVTIDGQMEGWSYYDIHTADASQLLTVSGGAGHVFKYLSGGFDNCSNLTVFNCPDWNVLNVTDMKYMFRDANAGIDFNISNWDTSNVTTMASMFSYVTINSIDLSTWNVSNVKDMSELFAYSTISSLDITSWDTSSVTNMSYMFSYVTYNVDVSNFNTSNVMRFEGMFTYSSMNPDVSLWNLSSCVDLSYMFAATTVANPDVSLWDVSHVTNMTSMFYYSASANPYTLNWTTNNVIYMNNAFNTLPSMTNAVSDAQFWNNLGGSTTSVISHSYTFYNSINISNFGIIPVDWIS